MNWKQQIEAQIAYMRDHYKKFPRASVEVQLPDTMQALFDVAVAADKADMNLVYDTEFSDADSIANELSDSLDKLREMGDE